ncbi:hypothetical protein COCC4DRAFT_200423 [Bipolaris maydis ATCC 48331]|uniref:Uncharacterized protein n=2 Tax=Cochliobolus heterostrophus TaxID=5016 RepID=M2UEY6_COCH5|nr:uncharacterized protein COCC4DRAFT_200423 [Bipolaris maydis ATCC 48331]EMD86568.1 hypothetical protein COCHEDRAFT_1197996 [Bipolaris maydis C5]KAJ5051198.1 hypothetical protein J3E74DRAFT_283208 [Bipolaris maydis]ENI02983.1 hypothetical protein COCC4DRAFT_200423 [Bipolaris maydis ATCC 48331]KAJ5052673.1 hypothetical protein J3E74DRAFT_469601 [Bipolaris maydis]KAJ6192342.1 hypothetical protein J3E72DRAFT_253919 [Bipolaris maydis]
MDTSCSYRVAIPAPLTQPLDWEPVNEIPYWDFTQFHKDVHQILKDANVVVCAQRLVKRFRPGMVSAPTTLLIESDLSIDGQYMCWKTGAKRLRNFLDNHGLEQLLVEIIDSKAAYLFSAGPLLDCRPGLFANWRLFVPTLLEEIKEQKWLAIDVVSREFGTKFPIHVPTVLITTKDPENEIWRQKIIPRLRYCLPPDMDIDILYGSQLSHAASSTQPDNHTAMESPIEDASPLAIHCTLMDYSNVVQIGSSIGLDQSSSSATISAVVKLRNSEGKETTCGLTNHHAIAPENSLAEKNCPIGRFLSPDHEICRGELVRVVAPSHTDHQNLVKFTSRERAGMQLRIQNLIDSHRQESRFYDTENQMLQKHIADYKILNDNPNRLFGTVFASSGFRICNNTNYTIAQRESFSQVASIDNISSPSLHTRINGRTLDFGLNWALVKLATDRQLADYITGVPLHIKIPTSASATRYTQVKHDRSYNVVKKGRSTGWTVGKISRIGSLLNLRNDNTNIVPVDLSHRYGAANDVILAFGVVHEQKHKDFMRGGDSGSCVLLNEDNATATMVGLLFASNEFTRVSYMMPIDLVIRDIEYVTRQKVTQPKFIEYDKRFDGL